MTLAILWFMIIALLIAVYYVLDGFDLGAGILMPFVAKTEGERKALVHSVGPVWDGNEVWLLTAGGALFAAFAPAYATSFSGFYLAIMLVLFGLIVRAVSIEFRMHDAKWRKLWDVLFFVGSLVPALLFGVALGNCLQGIPLAENGDYIGGFFGLLTPFPLACGVLGLATIITQGACWLSAKTELGSELQLRAKRVRAFMQIVTVIIVFVVSLMFFFVVRTRFAEGPAFAVAIIATIVLLAALVIGFLASSRGKDWVAFFSSSLVCVALVVLFAASMFPNLIVSTGPGPSIDIASAASSDLSLTVMTIVACIGVPLVLVYHILVYRTFRGRIAVEE